MSSPASPPVSAPPPLELVDLRHRFGDTPVLDGIDLTVEPGELVVVLGASGCGKTSILRAIAGLTTPTDGTIRIGGKAVCEGGRDRVPVEQRRVGLVFQEYALFPFQTVRENVGFGLNGDGRERVGALLETVGLADYADRRPGQLSGGQQQRVALARALAPNPHLLLLDEPFANVDASLRNKLGHELVSILEQRSTCALMVTHDQADALGFASRLAVLVAGDNGARVAQFDQPETVYQRPATREVAQLLGSAAFIEVDAEGESASSEFGTLSLIAPAEGRATVVLRPEHVRFVPVGDGPVRVTARRFVGRGHRLVCSTSAGPVQVDHYGGETPAIGAQGRIELIAPCWALPRPD